MLTVRDPAEGLPLRIAEGGARVGNGEIRVQFGCFLKESECFIRGMLRLQMKVFDASQVEVIGVKALGWLELRALNFCLCVPKTSARCGGGRIA